MSDRIHYHGIETAAKLVDDRRFPEGDRFAMLQQMTSQEKALFLGAPHLFQDSGSWNLTL